jgi:hypothetical protein
MISKVDESFIDLTNLLVQIQRDFDYMPGNILEEALIEDGMIKTVEEKYRALIIPPMDTISRKTWQKIVYYIDHGGIVIALDIIPRYTTEGDSLAVVVRPSFPAVGRDKIFSYMSFSGGGKTYNIRDIKDIEAVLDLELKRDLGLAGRKDPEVFYCHRHDIDHDTYFIANNSSKNKKLDIVFASQGRAEIWDPHSGEISAISTSGSPGNGKAFSFELERFDGTLIVFNRSE